MHVYHTAKHDTTKVLALNAIAYEYRNTKPDTCIALVEKAVTESEKIGFEQGKAWAWCSVARVKIIQGDFEAVKVLLAKAQQIFEKAENMKGQAWCCQIWGNFYQAQSNYALGIEKHEQAIAICKKIKDEQNLYRNIASIGMIHLNQSNYTKALTYYQQGLAYAEKAGNKEDIARYLANIGVIYNEQENLPKALAYYKRSLKVGEEMGNKINMAANLNNIAITYQKQNDDAEALAYYERSIVVYKEIGNKNAIALPLNNIGGIYARQKNYTKALVYYKQSVELLEKIGNRKDLTYPLTGIAEVYQHRKDYEKSIEYATRSLQIAQEINAIINIRETSHVLFQTYKLKGDAAKALEYHELYKQMNDSIFNIENTEKITNIENKAATAAKEKEIEWLNKNQEILKKDGELQRMIIYIIVVFSGIGMVVSYFLFISRKRNIRAKNVAKELAKKIELQRQAISQQADELHITLQTVEKQRDDITASIAYALRIQQAILPLPEHITQHLPAHFVLFKPRDVVSGDFYYFEEKKGKLILAAVDCTGHGIPGAFMTMIASEILNEIIQHKDIVAPDTILNELHKRVRLALKQQESQNRDGMDLSLVVIDKKAKTMDFAGAKNPLLYIQNNEIIQLKADKMPIGGEQTEAERVFTKQTINLDQSTTVYLFSDGYQDQFGGTANKKFMIANMRNLFLQIYQQPMHTQKEILDHTINEWIKAGKEEQIDDILVIGLRLEL